MQSTKALFTLENPAINEILLSVGPVIYGRYGVFADASLIAVHENRASADAHCQRLIHIQADVPCLSASPLRRHGDHADDSQILNMGAASFVDTGFLGM
jgi:hypothetical protein